jgi:hypothetical protein
LQYPYKIREPLVITDTVFVYDCPPTVKCSCCSGSGDCQKCDGRGTVECKRCKGTGYVKEIKTVNRRRQEKKVPCPRCKNGDVACPSCNGKKICTSCKGKGYVTCARCNGAGRFHSYKVINTEHKEDVREVLFSNQDISPSLLSQTDMVQIWDGILTRKDMQAVVEYHTDDLFRKIHEENQIGFRAYIEKILSLGLDSAPSGGVVDIYTVELVAKRFKGVKILFVYDNKAYEVHAYLRNDHVVLCCAGLPRKPLRKRIPIVSSIVRWRHLKRKSSYALVGAYLLSSQTSMDEKRAGIISNVILKAVTKDKIVSNKIKTVKVGYEDIVPILRKIRNINNLLTFSRHVAFLAENSPDVVSNYSKLLDFYKISLQQQNHIDGQLNGYLRIKTADLVSTYLADY